MDLAALYRDIAETSPDGIWVFDLEGRTIYANPEIARMYGIDQSELGDLTVFDTLDAQGRREFAAHLAELRQGHVNTTEVEVQFVRRDGSTRWVLVRESTLRAPDGSGTAVLHRITDYRERRRILESLRTSERRLAEAQRIARIGSWEWDVERDEITASAELAGLYGLRPGGFPATYAGFLEIVHPDDRETVDAAVRGAFDDAESFEFTARVRTSDGWMWTRGRGVSVRDATGRVVSMSGTHQDISEAKQAEADLQDQVTQNVLLQAVATAANEARTLEELLGQAQLLVLLHDDWERARAFVPAADGYGVLPLYIHDEDREADALDAAATEAELRLANRAFHDRAPVWDDARLTIAFPVAYADEVCAVIAIRSAPPLYRHDMITAMVEQVGVQLGRVAERERAERELATARDAAMEASRQKSEFLATMSHEIRTPLNGVIGLNDLLMRTPLTADQLRLASGVQVASRALLAVINDVLDFSKIEAGKLQLERLDFEVRGVFDQVAGLLAEQAHSKGLELMVSCHPDVPEVLSGDPTRLAQVLTNLGSNAVKFTERGEVFIRATAGAVADGATVLRVEVADTGVGVEAARIGHLFDPFTQADASTTRVYGGTGLGLAISREIVEALGGTIGLEPNPGGGSVFWFTATFDEPAGPAAEPDDEYARTWLHGRRMLVVDDNDHNRLILEEQLARWRVRSIPAAGADEAIAALARAAEEGDPVDGVLIDALMPRRDGLDLAEEIRRNPAYDHLPLLLHVSLPAPDAERVAACRIGGCLTKPVLSGELRTALLRVLAGVDPRPEDQPAEAAGAGYRHRVLVVEDNPVNRMVAVGMLEALGYLVETAEDGVVALDTMAQRDYAAVLMDVQMPRLDGYATTRELRLRERDGRVPVIAMTAAAVEGERDRCLASGMDDFLTKPVDLSALRAVLGRWVHDDGDHGPVPQHDTEADKREKTMTAGLDVTRLDELRDLDPGDTRYLDRAIGNFVANTPTTMAAIREAYEKGDPDTLRQLSHKLAGGALNLGVTGAGQIAQQIELVADTGSLTGAGPLVEELDAALATGREALLAYQASYAG